jgi:bifunctional DNase/RNase
MDMISLAQRSVVPIHLMKELVSPHRKILEIFAEILENIPVK